MLKGESFRLNRLYLRDQKIDSMFLVQIMQMAEGFVSISFVNCIFPMRLPTAKKSFNKLNSLVIIKCKGIPRMLVNSLATATDLEALVVSGASFEVDPLSVWKFGALRTLIVHGEVILTNALHAVLRQRSPSLEIVSLPVLSTGHAELVPYLKRTLQDSVYLSTDPNDPVIAGLLGSCIRSSPEAASSVDGNADPTCPG